MRGCPRVDHGPGSPPTFITHYYRPDRRPFLNLSELDEFDLERVLTELNATSHRGMSERRFGARYMPLRRATEEVLRRRFIEGGGRPSRTSPHYFVLGESEWFGGLYRDAKVVQLRLADIDTEQISFTYPDSVTSMGLSQDFGVPVRPRAYHGTVFRIEQLADVLRLHGYPRPAKPETYDRHQFEEFEHYIEVQLWSDEPIRDHMV